MDIRTKTRGRRRQKVSCSPGGGRSIVTPAQGSGRPQENPVPKLEVFVGSPFDLVGKMGASTDNLRMLT